MDLGTFLSDSLEVFSNFQQSHPFLGSMVTAEATFLTGDAVSQLISDKKIDGRKLRYTAALAPLYGLAIKGALETGELVGRYISDNPLVKAALGPNLFGNLINTFFFVNNTVGERTNYELPELARNYRDILADPTERKSIIKRFKEKYLHNIPKKEFINSVIGTLTAWNAFQWYNYAHVDKDMRTATTLGAGVIWLSLLSLWSLKGRRKIVETKPSMTAS